MVIGDILAWWYTEGWRQCFTRAKGRIEGIVDYFSIGLLVKTLFSPFRQISAGQVSGPLDFMVRAFFDRLISRCIGAVVRLIMVGIGIVTLVLTGLLTAVLVVFWVIIPIMPLLGVVLFISGWVPWNP